LIICYRNLVKRFKNHILQKPKDRKLQNRGWSACKCKFYKFPNFCVFINEFSYFSLNVFLFSAVIVSSVYIICESLICFIILIKIKRKPQAKAKAAYGISIFRGWILNWRNIPWLYFNRRVLYFSQRFGKGEINMSEKIKTVLSSVRVKNE